MINLGCVWGSGKRIDPRLLRRKKLDKSTYVRPGPFMPIILRLNIESQSANKIYVISQLATRHKALQETHCINLDQLVILAIWIFTLAGWVLSRKHGFVHLSTRNLAGLLRINPGRYQQSNGCVWTLMVARLLMFTNH